MSVEPHRGIVVGPRAPDVVAPLLALAGSLRRGTLRLALAGAAGAAVIAYALLRHGFRGDAGRAALTVVGLAVVTAPPLVLGAFWLVLRELLELPERLRRMPMETREHAEQLRALTQQARARQRGWSLPQRLWRLARLSASSRELLTPYAPLLPLIDLRFLAAVVLSAAAAAVEAVVALVVLLELLFA